MSNFRGLETIPENTDEHSSMNRTRDHSRVSGVNDKAQTNIHLSMPVSQNKDSELLKQPKFMFNSLQKANQRNRGLPSFPKVSKGDFKVMVIRVRGSSCSRLGRQGAITILSKRTVKTLILKLSLRTVKSLRVERQEASSTETVPRKYPKRSS
jgi:SpoVK/Ycf46/Vps4 family AAA+-type ATPase